MKATDLRYIKTEELIIDAFMFFAAQYGMEDIHIKDICNKARISRNAFYGHYENKYQVLDTVFRITRNKMLDRYTRDIARNLARNSMKDVSRWCVRAVHDNETELRILARCSKKYFRELIREVFISGTLRSIYDHTEEIRKDTRLRMIEAYISDGLTSMILVWLEHPDEITEEQFADSLYEISHDAVEYFYQKLDASKIVSRKTSLNEK